MLIFILIFELRLTILLYVYICIADAVAICYKEMHVGVISLSLYLSGAKPQLLFLYIGFFLAYSGHLSLQDYACNALLHIVLKSPTVEP